MADWVPVPLTLDRETVALAHHQYYCLKRRVHSHQPGMLDEYDYEYADTFAQILTLAKSAPPTDELELLVLEYKHRFGGSDPRHVILREFAGRVLDLAGVRR